MTAIFEQAYVKQVSRYETPAYNFAARLLHWLVFALVALQVLIGWMMPDIRPGTPQEDLVGWHISVGAMLLVVVIARIAWRLMHPVTPAASLQRWEYRLARIVHAVLYGLLLVLPLLGWIASGYYGYTVWLFGIFRLPALANRTMEWAHAAGDVHAFLVNVLIATIAVHVAGALYHRFIRRDDVLQRMLPWI